MLHATFAVLTMLVHPAALSFDAGGDKIVEVRNTSAAPLAIDAIAMAPGSDGFIVQPTAPRTLAPGETLTLHVTFTPDGKRTQAFGGVQIRSGAATRAVAGVAELVVGSGRALRRVQTGRVNHYVLGVAVGVVILIVIGSWR